MSLENYFSPFKKNIVGINQTYESPYGIQKMIYADWTASGRLYYPIEKQLLNTFGPFVANTHTETSTAGAAMTLAYNQARNIIKHHVNASKDDVLITEGSGMTGVVNKFQRILGLKVSENLKEHTQIPEQKRPIVFVSHMEHHSNQTSWIETIAEVVVVPCNDQGLICLDIFEEEIKKYADRPIKIASISAGSNVTGIKTEYHKVASLIHKYGGLCFVDFACSAPYVDIDMHPKKEDEYLDAIFFSPHKFLGGPGTSGVLIFNKKLYKNMIPDNPGGGTVSYTNPWGGHDYFDDVETREDGGTPAFLQTIKIALAIKVKDKMTTDKIKQREDAINPVIFECLESLEGVKILAPNHKDRLSIFSFYYEKYHFNLVVKLLNDRFGIQTRGGCSCAGTYGHFLLNVNQNTSNKIKDQILEGCNTDKPGWVRLSIHPTVTDDEVKFICDSLISLTNNIETWAKEYQYDSLKNDYTHISAKSIEKELIADWFTL
ncbi:aminotransferase class V-fold PLP-dependent enzyme [Tenacibaculum finnmarkense]|uniref:aminotransferase class V-fold PLP-dependent enzyme n=1 Tax=Tenacibaculum finnmarkense TaxID=2781243 RepID=UPI001E653A7C|nr:aminotransferase class V-fold PLP-dependent enzyme [Tenacibaculum finnmarkense]MCD8400713.1 aminotransferase class V-fold PLP-dependent enzyme [Tenacibaculum finnmarkense genomovar ulcerans]MCG8785810.1 aminotransferase class V-fold PLP-dependent enzyme [Tenacibaculum finnmarkense]MCG8795979.1 aminotransferase class V-fold PLP-dependent enzyme [Tenacibaculum finnmarkense]MCG8798411.1 aminotransferase class V-fold PLP-dependent enzyme [Tenacibaculum finnmarkense]MCG8813473.1 aminotransferase